MIRLFNNPTMALIFLIGFVTLAAYSQQYRIVRLTNFDFLTQLDIMKNGL